MMPAYTPYTPFYQPYMNYQPYQMQTPAQQSSQTQAQSSILWVRNANEAMLYPLAPNNAVALWDSSSPVIYLKQADASGKPTMKTYDLVERAETPVEPPKTSAGDLSSFATKSELAELAGVVKDVDGLIAELREDVNGLKKKKVKRDEDDG